MTICPPPDGEVLEAAHVTGLVSIPGSKKKARLGIGAISRECTKKREVCREDGNCRRYGETEFRIEHGRVGEPVESMYP
jgi:hypothetical protein